MCCTLPQVASDLGRLEFIITGPAAYSIVQREIDKRIKEGRSSGRLRPKHVFIVDGEDEFCRTVDPKLVRCFVSCNISYDLANAKSFANFHY
jgi:hypothetical protein